MWCVTFQSSPTPGLIAKPLEAVVVLLKAAFEWAYPNRACTNGESLDPRKNEIFGPNKSVVAVASTSAPLILLVWTPPNSATRLPQRFTFNAMEASPPLALNDDWFTPGLVWR